MRSEQPLVQARRVVVAVQIGAGSGEVREGVRAVDDHGDAARAVPARPPRAPEDLPREVDHVAHQDQPRARRDAASKRAHDLVRVLGRDRQRTLRAARSLPPLALPEGGDHPRVVLLGRHHLVARAARSKPQLADLQALGGVAGDRDLLARRSRRARRSPGGRSPSCGSSTRHRCRRAPCCDSRGGAHRLLHDRRATGETPPLFRLIDRSDRR